MVENEKALGENLPKEKIVMYGTAAEEAMLRKALEEFRQKPKLNAKIKCLDPKRTALEKRLLNKTAFARWC